MFINNRNGLHYIQGNESRLCEDGSIWWHEFHPLARKDDVPTLKIPYVFDPDRQSFPEPSDANATNIKVDRKKRKEDELVCRGHILMTFLDWLYDLFCSVKFSREIWKALEFKYNTEKQWVYKFLVMTSFEFSMIDSIRFWTKPRHYKSYWLNFKILKLSSLKHWSSCNNYSITTYFA